MAEALPFTYLAKKRYWRFRHKSVGDVAIAGEPFSSCFIANYRLLLDGSGLHVPESRIARLVDLAENEARGGSVYFVGWQDGPIKIGVAVDVLQRLRILQTACPFRLSVLATTTGGSRKERHYHFRFRRHRLHGEWFERCPEIEAEITRLTEIGGARG